MKRKLFSVLLCAFALLLLMGAGSVPEEEAALLAEEESTALVDSTQETDVQTMIEAGEMAPQTEGEGALVPLTDAEEVPVPPAADTDDKLQIDGVAAPTNLMKERINGVTYVALAPMATLLDPSAQVGWDSAAGGAVVTTAKLRLIARVGDPYVEANGRYLYLDNDHKVQVKNGRTILPLSVITECFGATLAWDSAADVIQITRGSGAIVSGNEFYNQDDLFWLSRIIHSESGNQPLKGQMAVGNVVMNRVASPIYPNTVEGVLAQKNQFSTYKSGKLAKCTPNKSSVIAAKLVLDGGVVKETDGALYFDSSKNSWAARNKKFVAVIGNHRFYR